MGPIIDEIFTTAWAQGRRERREQYAFDALIELARRARNAHDPRRDSESDRTETSTGETDSTYAQTGEGDASATRSHNGESGDGEANARHNNRNTAQRGTRTGEASRGTDTASGGTGDTEASDTTCGATISGETTFGETTCGETSESEASSSDEPKLLPATSTSNDDGDIAVGASNGDGGTAAAAGTEDKSQSEADDVNQPGSRSAKKRHRRRRRRANSPTYLALLRIDFAALQRGHTQGDELCEIAGIGPIPVSRARELLSESVVKLIATKGQRVANVTHYGRKPNTAQRMALLWSQPTCSVLGCDHSIVQIDHRDDWHKTHRTRLEDLDPLCPHHHRLKTYHGWALVEGTGKRAMVPPDDPRHPDNQRQPATASV